MSIDEATIVDNTRAASSNAMSIDEAITVDNAGAPTSNAMSIDEAVTVDNAGAPTSNAMSIDEAATVEKAGAGSDSSGLKDNKDLFSNEAQSKVSDVSQLGNQEPEAESFLRGVVCNDKWQELISKWLAFEKDYPIKGVFLSFYFMVVSSGTNDMAVHRTYQLRVGRRKLHGG